MSPPAQVAAVLLTQGTRPGDLAHAIDSVLAQAGVSTEIVVVGNGWDPASADPPLPAGVRTVHLPANVGIPAGRNAGVGAVAGDVLLFLDDDASLVGPGFLATGAAMLERDVSLGLVQPRVTDPNGHAARQWVPRIRKGDATRSGNVFSCWEGAILIRRETFEATGGWAAGFWYAHEGIELAWRVWDHGQRAWYAGDLIAHHPVISQTRHSDYHRLNARNRVWLARRNLPLPLIPLYVGSWTLVQVARWAGKPAALAAWFGGWWEGWRSDPGERRPMRWATVVRMTLAGRPPVV